jgi:uridylate kinase
VQTAVVVGGGNYFRGRTAPQWGIDRAEADNIGMLATVMNALMLRGELNAKSDCDVRVMTATGMPAFAEPFVRLRARRHLELGRIMLLAGGIGQPYVTTDYAAVQRALELDADALLLAKHGVDAVYDRDPRTHPDATRYEHLSHRQALALGVQVMDVGALVLAAEHRLPMHVFDAAATGATRAVCGGADIGTSITTEALS